MVRLAILLAALAAVSGCASAPHRWSDSTVQTARFTRQQLAGRYTNPVFHNWYVDLRKDGTFTFHSWQKADFWGHWYLLEDSLIVADVIDENRDIDFRISLFFRPFRVDGRIVAPYGTRIAPAGGIALRFLQGPGAYLDIPRSVGSADSWFFIEEKELNKPPRSANREKVSSE